jgi:hypothetical protein
MDVVTDLYHETSKIMMTKIMTDPTIIATIRTMTIMTSVMTDPSG